jgi:hypothetical protein
MEVEDRLRAALRLVAAEALASPDALGRMQGRRDTSFDNPAGDFGPPGSEGRKARRHRWLAMIPAVGVAALLVSLALVVNRSNPPGSHVEAHPRGPSRSVASNAGAVAYVSGGRLWFSDGMHTVELARPRPSGTEISSANWSADGTYLSYVAAPPGAAAAELHVVAVDGSGDRVGVRGTIFATAWAGVGHTLAASLAPGPATGGLVVLTPDGPTGQIHTRQVVARATAVYSFTWAKRGTMLAYSIARGGAQPDEVHTRDVMTGNDTMVATGPAGAGILIASWWPGGDGLLWWVDPAHSASIEADGLMLQSFAFGGGKAVDLIRTTVYLPWVAWAPDGATLATVTGGGRFPWDNKRLALCRPRQRTCTVVPTPTGTVAFGPAWSPDGRQLAFVRAAAVGTVQATTTFSGWYPSRRLWTSAADGSGQALVPGSNVGVAAVSWAASDLLRYSTADTIEAIHVIGGTPVKVANGLRGGSAGAGPDAYGKQPWIGVAAWRP